MDIATLVGLITCGVMVFWELLPVRGAQGGRTKRKKRRISYAAFEKNGRPGCTFDRWRRRNRQGRAGRLRMRAPR